VTRQRALSHRGAVALALVVTLLWSSSWVLIRWGLDDEGLRPVTFAGVRYALAVVLLWAWAAGRGERRRLLVHLAPSTLARLALLGLLQYALTQGALFVALDLQPATTTSLLLALTPLAVAALSPAWLREVPHPRQVAGAVVVAGGAAAFFSGSLGATAGGLAAALVALAANAGSSLLGRAVNREGALPPWLVTLVSMSTGAALLVGVGFSVEGLPSISGRGWAIIGWLAAVNTALAFTWWNLSLRRLSALESAVLNNSMLVQIALLAWLVLGEALGPEEGAGVVLVTAGVLLVSVRRGGSAGAG
jgi:drug/metabolite transporter (DMT)-like permease